MKISILNLKLKTRKKYKRLRSKVYRLHFLLMSYLNVPRGVICLWQDPNASLRDQEILLRKIKGYTRKGFRVILL